MNVYKFHDLNIPLPAGFSVVSSKDTELVIEGKVPDNANYSNRSVKLRFTGVRRSDGTYYVDRTVGMGVRQIGDKSVWNSATRSYGTVRGPRGTGGGRSLEGVLHSLLTDAGSWGWFS